MRTSMAYFAGAGTVIAAIGLGLGGGLTIANVLSPHQEKLEQTKLEQRMSAKPISPSAQTDQPKVQTANTSTATDKPQAEQGKAPVPYVAATNAAISANNAPATPGEPQPQAQAAASSPQPAEARVANESVKPVEPQTAKPQSPPREQASSAPDDGNATVRSPEDANAKARDSDLKRLAAEKRKADRRQQWADRKKAQQQRDAELRDVEASVRRDTDGPRIVVRQDDDDFGRRGDSDRRRDFDRRGGSDRPFGFPGFNLFGGDRDD